MKEEEQLHKANLLAKKRVKLGNKIIKFNSSCITHKFNMIHLTQERQCKNHHPVAPKSMDLSNLREKIRKAVTSKDQYITQHA